MAFRVLFSQKSVEDLETIIEYYLSKSEQVASSIYSSIVSRAESLEELAERGRMVPEFLDEDIRNFRELIEGNFRIIYRIKGKNVEIVRIVDSRQLLNMQIDK
jgi:plasmid stabilization system protein ParE